MFSKLNLFQKNFNFPKQTQKHRTSPKTIDDLTQDYSGNLIFCNVLLHRDNLGDVLITGLLVNKLRRYGRIVSSGKSKLNSKYDEVKLFENEDVSEYDLKFNYLVLLAGIKALFSGGKLNVYLIDSPGHRFGGGKRVQTLKHFLQSIHYSIFKAIGIKICTFGVSIGPFSKSLEILERFIAQQMYFYSVRDSLSKNYAHSIGIKKVELFPDLAWFLEASDRGIDVPTIANEPQIQDLSKLEGDYVILSFRESTHNFAKNSNYQSHLFRMLDKIVDLVCIQWSKKILITYQVTSDYQFCQLLYDRYHDTYDVTLLDEKVRSQSLSLVYSKASLVFTNRLHVLMFSMACGALPFAAIDTEHHDKITGILQDANLQSLIIDIHQDAMVAENSIREIVANVDEIKQRISHCYDRTRCYGNAILDRVMAGTLQ
jgi:polysaccharide pyruvyl transferase WcaK-like protein